LDERHEIDPAGNTEARKMTSTTFEDVSKANVNGTTLAYREEGEGEPVVFVHGTLSDMRVWDQQVPSVGRSYRAITYSRRFAPPNEDIDLDVDDQMQPHVHDLAAFLREIGAEPAHLVGSSWGAFIALLTAAQHPELVRTLVLEEPPVVPLFVSMPPRPAELLRLFATRPRTGIALLGFVTRTLAPAQKALERGEDERAMETFLVGVLGRAAYEQLSEARMAQLRENRKSFRAQILGAGFPTIGDDDVRSVRAPVLLLTGEHSPAFLLRLTDRLEELLPTVDRAEIPNASHAMHEENASAVNEAIVGFLGRHHAGST
jgi:pimeloyl-ACP methyl ester carboxylesterase